MGLNRCDDELLSIFPSCSTPKCIALGVIRGRYIVDWRISKARGRLSESGVDLNKDAECLGQNETTKCILYTNFFCLEFPFIKKLIF
jgi:hypothetical protein